MDGGGLQPQASEGRGDRHYAGLSRGGGEVGASVDNEFSSDGAAGQTEHDLSEGHSGIGSGDDGLVGDACRDGGGVLDDYLLIRLGVVGLDHWGRPDILFGGGLPLLLVWRGGD